MQHVIAYPYVQPKLFSSVIYLKPKHDNSTGACQGAPVGRASMNTSINTLIFSISKKKVLGGMRLHWDHVLRNLTAVAALALSS